MRKFFRAVLMMKSIAAVVAVGFAVSEIEAGAIAKVGSSAQQGGNFAATTAPDRRGG